MSAQAEFFFMPGSRGRLFVQHLRPGSGEPSRAVLLVPPFAGELNRSRRTLVLQGRALAGIGYQVLMVDLYGCGDSEGDFRDADWQIWIEDLEVARSWLAERAGTAVDLWALRLGVPLALDLIARSGSPPPACFLWQPTVSGRAVLNEFLRVYVAGQMLTASRSGSTVRQLRERLDAGEVLEIGGYELNPALARSIAEAELTQPMPAATRVHWFEVRHDDQRTPAPASAEVLESWRAGGAPVTVDVVKGGRFWQSTEIVECTTLIEATTGRAAGAPA